jgi:nitrous oxide reductase
MSYLPQRGRPFSLSFKSFKPGYDLPYEFYLDLKAIDSKLYLVWHPFNVLYDTIMNRYTGTLADPRFAIEEKYGKEVWGWVTTDNRGKPLSDETWHIWRLCDPYGWAHICGLASKEAEYLKLIVNRLHLQAQVQAEDGDLAYGRKLREKDEEAQDKAHKDKTELLAAIHKENSWLLDKAMENFNAGKTAPTKPTKDVIVSYSGQKNHSKIVRDISDKEGGLILPDSWR